MPWTGYVSAINVHIYRSVVSGPRYVGGVTGRFAYKSFRLQVDSPTSRSFRLHDLSRFAYIEVDSPTLKTYFYSKY